MVKLSTKSFRKSREFSDTSLDSPLTSVPNGFGDSTLYRSNEKLNEISDARESSDSDQDRSISDTPCSVHHDGRQVLVTEVALHIDEVFTMMFTNSKFVKEINSQRNITEYDISSEWRRDPRSGLKSRQITFTLPLSGLGPKESFVTETHTMNNCSKPGVRYSVDVVAENTGVPYADSFTVLFHNCLEKIGDKLTRISLYGDIKFKKPVWGMVRGLIEKPTMTNLDSYTKLLEKNLTRYAEGVIRLRKPRPRRPATVSESLPCRSSLKQPETSRLRLLGLLSMLGLLVAINCQLYIILRQEGTRPCLLMDSWEERLSKEHNADQIPEYEELLAEFTRKQRQQLVNIKRMLFGEIEALKKTEQAISTIIDNLDSPPKQGRGGKHQLRKLIGI